MGRLHSQGVETARRTQVSIFIYNTSKNKFKHNSEPNLTFHTMKSHDCRQENAHEDGVRRYRSECEHVMHVCVFHVCDANIQQP